MSVEEFNNCRIRFLPLHAAFSAGSAPAEQINGTFWELSVFCGDV